MVTINGRGIVLLLLYQHYDNKIRLFGSERVGRERNAFGLLNVKPPVNVDL